MLTGKDIQDDLAAVSGDGILPFDTQRRHPAAAGEPIASGLGYDRE
jgi:hypothetical protein